MLIQKDKEKQHTPNCLVCVREVNRSLSINDQAHKGKESNNRQTRGEMHH